MAAALINKGFRCNRLFVNFRLTYTSSINTGGCLVVCLGMMFVPNWHFVNKINWKYKEKTLVSSVTVIYLWLILSLLKIQCLSGCKLRTRSGNGETWNQWWGLTRIVLKRMLSNDNINLYNINYHKKIMTALQYNWAYAGILFIVVLLFTFV